MEGGWCARVARGNGGGGGGEATPGERVAEVEKHLLQVPKSTAPPPKSGGGGGPKAIENTLAPTWEAQPVPPVLGYCEATESGFALRIRTGSKKRQDSVPGPAPCLHPPSPLVIAGGVGRRSRWRSQAIKALKLMIVEEKLLTFIFRHLDCRIHTSWLLPVFFPVPGMTVENGCK